MLHSLYYSTKTTSLYSKYFYNQLPQRSYYRKNSPPIQRHRLHVKLAILADQVPTDVPLQRFNHIHRQRLHPHPHSHQHRQHHHPRRLHLSFAPPSHTNAQTNTHACRYISFSLSLSQCIHTRARSPLERSSPTEERARRPVQGQGERARESSAASEQGSFSRRTDSPARG